MSYGRKITGSIHDGNLIKGEGDQYLSIEYLGLDPSRSAITRFEVPENQQRSFFDRLFRRESVPSFYNQLIQIETQVTDEIKTLARYCKEKLKIP